MAKIYKPFLLIVGRVLPSLQQQLHMKQEVKNRCEATEMRRVGMTVSDCAVRSFHGKKGGQTDILNLCICEGSP